MRSMRPILIVFAFPVLLSVSSLQGSSAPSRSKPSLCTKQEEVYFTSGFLNNKLASICTSSDVSYTSGYLVYRYGTSDRKIELSLPQRPIEFRRFVTLEESGGGDSGEEDEFIRIRNGKFSYVVYSAFSNDFDVHGLAVFENDELIKNMPSLSGSFEGSGAFEGLRHLGVPLEEKAKAQAIWRALLPASSVFHSRPAAAASK